jgi:hypothetical protein
MKLMKPPSLYLQYYFDFQYYYRRRKYTGTEEVGDFIQMKIKPEM